MATKVKLTGLRKDVKGLKVQILNAIDRSNFAKSLNTTIRARIRKVGIYPGLSEKTIDFRKRVVSGKGPKFRADKSSLTLSGQLLGAMITTFKKGRVSFFRNEKSEFIFDVEDKPRRPYKVENKIKKANSFSLKSRLSLPRSSRQLGRLIKESRFTQSGGDKTMKEVWDLNMKTRPVTRVFKDQQFKRRIELRLISAIKRYIK